MSSLKLDLVQVAALVGALQGLFLCGVLLAQRSNGTANRLLAALMLAFSVYLAWGPYYATGLYRSYPHFILISYLTPWVFGPLVYLYARAASDCTWRMTRRDLLHFALVALVFVLSVPFFALSGAEKIAEWDAWGATGGPDHALVGPPLRYLDPLKYVSGIAYSVATVLHLRRHRRAVEQNYSNLAHVTLRWLLWLSVATAAIWLLAIGLVYTHVGILLRDAEITFAMALLVYGIGYMGLRQPEIFSHTRAVDSMTGAIESPVSAQSEPVSASSPYERSGLDDPEAERLSRTLVGVMEREQPWKNSDLTLAQLALLVNSSPQKVSEVLNRLIGQSFYDFVNGYRVREVQRRVAAGHAKSLKLLALASDAGFASKSTFNEVFKRHTNLTPSRYRAAVGG